MTAAVVLAAVGYSSSVHVVDAAGAEYTLVLLATVMKVDSVHVVEEAGDE